MKHRILYIYEGKLTHHGIDRVVREQLRALVECDCQIDLASRGNPAMHGIVFHGRKWTIANLFSWLPRSIYYPSQKRVFMNLGAKLAAKKSYTKIIAWRERALTPFRIGVAKKIACYLSHDSMHWRGSSPSTKAFTWPSLSTAEMSEEYRLATRILVPSENSRQSFLRYGEASEKLCVIGRGVDTDFFTPAFPDKDSTFRVVFCGRVCERKGIRQVVEAWKLANLKNSELLVLGAVDKDLQDFVAANSGGNIRWMGFQKDIVETLKKCDAQILLSRREGMAKSLLEGASCGLATITTKDTGFPMEAGVNGFLVDREDTTRTAELLKQLQSNPSLVSKFGKEGRRTVVDGYSWTEFRRRFLRAIEIEV